jgi:hypothetical protein
MIEDAAPGDKTYLDFVSDNYLYITKDKSVLELASFFGWHTRRMLEQGASHITCVEPFTQAANESIYADDRVTLIQSTANDYYKTATEHVDVVTCMGLLYHLHSPLHLIEQITNINAPQYIIIETCKNEQNSFFFSEEINNVLGNAFADEGITKPVELTVAIDAELIFNCIETAGYKRIKSSVHVDEFECPSKRSVCLALFERIEDSHD